MCPFEDWVGAGHKAGWGGQKGQRGWKGWKDAGRRGDGPRPGGHQWAASGMRGRNKRGKVPGDGMDGMDGNIASTAVHSIVTWAVASGPSASNPRPHSHRVVFPWTMVNKGSLPTVIVTATVTITIAVWDCFSLPATWI
jgi:hypothetical protein